MAHKLKYKGIILFLSAFFLGTVLFGENKDESFKYDISYIKISKNTQSEILNKLDEFKPLPSSKNFGINNGNYFFKVEILNTLNQDQEVVFNIYTHNINKITTYKLEGNKLINYAVSGNKVIYDEQSMPGRVPNILVSLKAKEKAVYILQTNFFKEGYFPIEIKKRSAFKEDQMQIQLEIGLYIGFWLLVFINNIVLWRTIKEQSYLYYVLFVASILLAFLYYDGYVGNFLRGMDVKGNFEFAVHFIMNITLSLFSYKFLELKNYFPKIRYVVVFSFAIMGLFYMLFLITNNFLFFALGDLVGMLTFTIFWICSLTLISKLEYAKFYAIGSFFTLSAGYFYILALDFGFNPISISLLRMGCAIDLIIFTFAVAYKIKVINSENNSMKAELRNFLVESDKSRPLLDPFYVLLKENEITEQVLTLREIDVLKCVYEGKSNKEIADELFVSINTVKYHIKNIYIKLDIKNRKDMVIKISKIAPSN